MKNAEERLSRIKLANFVKVLSDEGKPEDYDNFRRVVSKYSDGSRRFYRLDGKECRLKALVVYHPLSICDGELPVDSHFEMWFEYNWGIYRPVSVGLDVSVLRMDEKPKYDCRVQDRDGFRTVEQWNKDRILGLERDKLRGMSPFRRDDARLSTRAGFSMDHSIEECRDDGVNQLLYEILAGMR